MYTSRPAKNANFFEGGDVISGESDLRTELVLNFMGERLKCIVLAKYPCKARGKHNLSTKWKFVTKYSFYFFFGPGLEPHCI